MPGFKPPPRVELCGMRTIIEDPAEVPRYRCYNCNYEWLGYFDECPACGDDRHSVQPQAGHRRCS